MKKKVEMKQKKRKQTIRIGKWNELVLEVCSIKMMMWGDERDEMETEENENEKKIVRQSKTLRHDGRETEKDRGGNRQTDGVRQTDKQTETETETETETDRQTE